MLVSRTKLMISTFILMIALSLLIKNTIIAGVVTIVVVIIAYIIIAYTRSKKRLDLIEEYCDPEAFIEATEKQRLITGKNPKINAYLNIDKAAGLILMGEFKKAKDILLSIDKSKLSVKNGTLLMYTVNLIGCYYELGENSEAEELFETKIPFLFPVNARMKMGMELLVAERLFYLNRYDESKEKFQSILLDDKLSKRVKLGILYILAQIDEKNGDMVSAHKKYKEVADNGNKLWIVEQSKLRDSIF